LSGDLLTDEIRLVVTTMTAGGVAGFEPVRTDRDKHQIARLQTLV
jgi:hypothetical protein